MSKTCSSFPTEAVSLLQETGYWARLMELRLMELCPLVRLSDRWSSEYLPHWDLGISWDVFAQAFALGNVS